MTLTETRRSKLINILNTKIIWSTRKSIFLYTLADNGLFRYHYKSFLRKSRAIAYNMGLRKSQIRKFLRTYLCKLSGHYLPEAASDVKGVKRQFSKQNIPGRRSSSQGMMSNGQMNIYLLSTRLFSI